MLKKSAIKRIVIASFALFIGIVFYLFPKDKSLNIPSEVIYLSENTIPIYAMNNNGYLSRINVYKNNDDEIPFLIKSLTINDEYLQAGFNPIIPKNTKLLSYELKNNILKLNFSKELLDVTKENEEKLIEGLIYTLCELDDVDKIMIFIEGNKLLKLPKSEKTIPSVLDKTFGINKVYMIDDIKNTSKATIYFLGKYNDDLYYIPITKITNEKLKPVEIIVNELKKMPTYETNLISYLNASYELKDYEILENSITISFNNKLLYGLKDDDINEKVKYTLSLSLRDTYNIKDVNVIIN